MFEQLNIINQRTENEILEELREYFKPMEITEEQKEERVDVGYKIYDIMLFFFSLCIMAHQNNMFEKLYLVEQLRTRWLEACKDKVEIDDYVSNYIDEIVEDIVVVTIEHFDSAVALLEADTGTKDKESELYYLSQERALNIGENEANSIMNYSELQKAKAKGYKNKEWITMRDKRVRKSHIKIDGKIIPIEDMFAVGDCLMLQPHDEFNGNAKECANCRCSLKFHK